MSELVITPTRREVAHGIVGHSDAMQRMLDRVEKIASSEARVLLLGETGTGKELVARAIHAASRRAAGPFEVLDCTAIPATLAESHLFGHVRGAFTGAIDTRQGAFQRASGGTLFVDEIGELPPALQPKLLRILEAGRFRRVGAAEELTADVRLVAATNRELPDDVARGRFRMDLYYRVAVVTIRVPPLRERREDIPLLVEHFVERFSAALGRSAPAVTRGAMARLVGLRWPGNVRQLEHRIERAIAVSRGPVLTERDVLVDDDLDDAPGAHRRRA